MSLETVTTYSGYTHGLFSVTETKEEDDSLCVSISLDRDFKNTIMKIMVKFSDMQLVTVNGLAGRVTSLGPSKTDRKCLQLSAKVDKVAAQALKLEKGSLVSIGVRSTNKDQWLLRGESKGIVTLETIDEPNKLTFKCSSDQQALIKDADYIGLNGSAFNIKEKTAQGFVVHTEKQTEEKTIFNPKQTDVGLECLLTLPA